eukprot:118330_1
MKLGFYVAFLLYCSLAPTFVKSYCTIDLGFCIDASGSLGKDGFDQEIKFTEKFIESITAGGVSFRSAAIFFINGGGVTQNSPFKSTGDALKDTTEFLKDNGIVFSSDEGTNIDTCLNDLMTSHESMKSTDSDLKEELKVMMVITGGDAEIKDVTLQKMKDNDWMSYALGFGTETKNETLFKLADNKKERVFKFDTIDALIEDVVPIGQDWCFTLGIPHYPFGLVTELLTLLTAALTFVYFRFCKSEIPEVVDDEEEPKARNLPQQSIVRFKQG